MLLALALWAWWISRDLPFPIGRPHQLGWDIIAFSRQIDGLPTARPNTSNLENPIVRLGVFCFRHFGRRSWSMTLAQAPFLALLVLSSGLLAWRLGGPAAGALAPWIAALAPMTVGLAVSLDDLTPMQAMITAALAALAWSSRPRRQWAALLALPCIVFGARTTIWASTGLWFLLIFAVAVVCLVIWLWIDWRLRAHDNEVLLSRRSTWLGAPWPAALGAALALLGGLAVFWPLPTHYLLREASRSELARLNWRHDYTVLLVGLVTWFRFHAGPVLGCLTLAGLAVAARRRVHACLPLLGWVFLPALLIAFLNKRHDFYLVNAVPGTYALAAVGLASLRDVKLRRWIAVLAVVLLASAWLGVMAHGAVKPSGRFSQMFEGQITPYLWSPYDFPRDGLDIMAGQFLAEKCGARKMTVVIARRGVIRGSSAFHAWLFDRKMPILELRSPPKLSSTPVCLVLDDYNPATTPLAQWLRGILTANNINAPAVDEYVNDLLARAPHFWAKRIYNVTILVEGRR